MDEMTPKQAYERRRAEREARRAKSGDRYGNRPPIFDEGEEAAMDMLDRFVTAVERIADVLEKRG